MVEIAKCRKCGSCCAWCIFLDFSEEDRLFSCIIYKNKHRTPITHRHVMLFFEQLDNNEHSEFIRKLIAITNEEYLTCDSYKCYTFSSKFKKDVLYDRINDFLKTEKKEIEEARKLIPNFYDLVEILNGG